MNDEELKKFKALFLSTARDYLKQLIDLTTQANVSDHEMVNTLHIAAHSLKGQSYAMQYSLLALIAKHLEYIFQGVLDGTLQLTEEQITVLQNMYVSIGQSLDVIDAENHERDLTEDIRALEQAFSGTHIVW